MPRDLAKSRGFEPVYIHAPLSSEGGAVAGSSSANEEKTMSDEDARVGYTGTGIECACPCCGEELFIFIPVEGKVTITARKDIPSEDDDEE
jgi:hypothetical protein